MWVEWIVWIGSVVIACVCFHVSFLSLTLTLLCVCVFVYVFVQVTRTFDMPEPQKLEFIREIGFTHMRISEGLNTQLQLMGCVARLSAMQHKAAAVGSTGAGRN